MSNVSANPRGLLIAICGIDGSGKTTQEIALADWLTSVGRQVLRTCQPTDWYRKTEWVREYLDHGVDSLGMHGLALLAAADRQRHVRSVIAPAVAEGTVVICNRYIYSTFAYFAARGLPLEFLRAINPLIPRPDLTILLDAPAQLSRERVQARDGEVLKFEERRLAFMEEVRASLRKNHDESFLILDANLPVAELAQTIRQRVEMLAALPAPDVVYV
jgi:dTMP kinase